MWFFAQIAGQPSTSKARIDGYGPGTDWAEAKIAIARKLNLTLSQCRFMHKGKILEDQSGTLHHCRIQADDVVIVQQLVSTTPTSCETLSNETIREEENIAEALAVDDGRILVADFVCQSCQKRPKSICYDCGCAKCGVKDDSQDNIVCEECDLWFHWQCLEPAIEKLPEDNWYCPGCRNDHDTIVRPGQKPMNSISKKKSKGGKGVGGMGNIGHPKKCTIVPPNHRGSIPGIEVGQSWKYRACCGGDGVHRPPIAGIAGSASGGGAVSIVLSDGYPEDKDFGDTFTYTGSGGRDLSGKRVAMQSFDQQLTRENLALAMTCDADLNEDGAVAKDWRRSLGVRVVRSFKLKRMHPKYAPEDGYRYDGIYKLVNYGPGLGASGFTVYRYEFRRDDAAPAPWTDQGKLRMLKLGLEMVVPDGYIPKTQRQTDKVKLAEIDTAPQPQSELPRKCDENRSTVGAGSLTDHTSRARKRDLEGYQRGQTQKNLEGLCIPGKPWLADLDNQTVPGKNGNERQEEESDIFRVPYDNGIIPLEAFAVNAPASKRIKSNVKDFLAPARQQVKESKLHHWKLPDELCLLLDQAAKANPLHRHLMTSLVTKEHRNLRSFMERMEKDFACPICQEFVQMPVTSPCGHIACLRCLNASIDTAFGARCSLCRASLVTREALPGGATKLNPVVEKNMWRKQVRVDRALVEIIEYCVPGYSKHMEAEEEKIKRRVT